MTATVTTATFKRIKDFVLSLKEQPARARAGDASWPAGSARAADYR